MNARERFLEAIVKFNRDVTPPKWEFGYWGTLIDKWYSEGLPKHHYPHVPKKITNLSASIATTACDLPPKNWSRCYVRIREENLLKEAG